LRFDGLDEGSLVGERGTGDDESFGVFVREALE